MNGTFILASAVLLVVALGRPASAEEEAPLGMKRIPNGIYRPIYRAVTDPKETPVKSFYLDELPVTNERFLEFARAVPRWRRSQVKRIFADENYLKHWEGDLQLGAGAKLNQPVVWVSWFAAKAFADWQGKRLPTTAEWELAAGASPKLADGGADRTYQQDILRWYSEPSPRHLPEVGQSARNIWGVGDLHGLVWEWTADFNDLALTGDGRGDAGLERQLFCGAGAAGARDVTNYPAFMRSGFRSSLKAAYTVHNLGFRCAKDL